MAKKRIREQKEAQKRAAGTVAFLISDAAKDVFCIPGYVRLDKCPEIVAGVMRIAELIGSMTIHLMSNTDAGDIRIRNELSRTIDINPMPNMTRMTWMQAIIKNLLLEGSGNSIVVPHTWNGYLQSLEPIAASRVGFEATSYRDYKVLIDGKPRDPQSVLHFVYNPDPTFLWKGQGITVPLRELAKNLKQAQVTTQGFLSSEWKPSLIVRVDGLTEEFSDPAGRAKLTESYMKPSAPGEPWVIPADLMEVTQVKPLTLKDLAIDSTIEIDKRTVAALIGCPAFLLGVGEYNKNEWNNFVQNKIRTIALIIQQEMTKKLILSEKWYLQLNFWSLLDYDIRQISDVMLQASDRGFVNGDEWRDRMNMAPAGLTEYKILENYIGYEYSNMQKKLIQGEE